MGNFFCYSIAVLMLLCPVSALSWETYWGQKRPVHRDPLNIHPASQVPHNLDEIVWVVTPFKGTDTSKDQETAAPVYERFEGISRVNYVGTVPYGTEVELQHFRILYHVYHYRIPTPDSYIADDPKAEKPEFLWIHGDFIKADRLKASESKNSNEPVKS